MMLTAVNSNLRIPFLSVALKNGRVRIDEIHRARLRLLIQEKAGGKQATFAGLIGKAPAQVSQWINASKDSTTGKRRAMDRSTAREIERKVALPDGWMDQPLSSDEAEALQTRGKRAVSGKGIQAGAEVAMSYDIDTEPAVSTPDAGVQKVTKSGPIGDGDHINEAAESAAPLEIPTSMSFTHPRLRSTVLLLGSLLGALDKRSRKTIATLLGDLSETPDDAADIARRIEANATVQARLVEDEELNRRLTGAAKHETVSGAL